MDDKRKQLTFVAIKSMSGVHYLCPLDLLIDFDRTMWRDVEDYIDADYQTLAESNPRLTH